MKRRRDGGEPETGNRPGSRVGSAPFKKQRNKHTVKLGGGGLSLEAFAGAKRKPLISPAHIKEHREFYTNAKKVQKYKKFVSQLGVQQDRGPKVEEAADPPSKVQDREMANNDISPEKKKKSGAGFAGKKPPFLNTHGKEYTTRRKQPQEPKSVSRMEKTRENFQKKKSDDKEMRREREELYRGQQQAREKARDQKAKQNKLRKRTQCGQPVMRHQMEQLLEIIQRGS